MVKSKARARMENKLEFIVFSEIKPEAGMCDACYLITCSE